MKGIVISFLMVPVAIAGLQISHARIRGHAVEDKVIKIVTGDSNIVQNLGADGDKDLVYETVIRIVKEEYPNWEEDHDEVNGGTFFEDLSQADGYSDALTEIKIRVRIILEEALDVDLYDAFDSLDLNKVKRVGDLVSQIKFLLPKPKAN
ncbi:hypothetical protein MKW98_032230 [Papaver atlanticum]|uniref:Uncharacterized protein n=1 Tax=Papaver atlanticum TaxID=357466 RepID=A0AAD4SEQ0_9MAGN|nr:hypothetical protein MKW98_032230 [Papaver atlanticum]